MMKLVIAGLLGSAALAPAAGAQDGSLREAMRARMQARIDARAAGGEVARSREPRVPDAERGDRQPPSRAEGEGWRRPDRPGAVRGWRGGRDERREQVGPQRVVPDRTESGRWQRPTEQADRSDNAWRDRDARDRDRRNGEGWRGRGDQGDGWRRGRDEQAKRDAVAPRRSSPQGAPLWRDSDRGWTSARNGSAGHYGNRWNDDRGRWTREWRRDPRYDWTGWRSAHRDAYRLPRYYSPFGWDAGYRRFSIGARLSSVLFARSYWIDDPYAYRLPEAYGPYRWVRYYDDALLVDLDSGEVVDVIHDLFW